MSFIIVGIKKSTWCIGIYISYLTHFYNLDNLAAFVLYMIKAWIKKEILESNFLPAAGAVWIFQWLLLEVSSKFSMNVLLKYDSIFVS